MPGHEQTTLSLTLPIPNSFERKDCLPLAANRVWRIQQGIVRTLTWDDQGHVTTLGLWGREDIVGKPLTKLNPYQIECLTPIMAIEVPLGSYSHLWQDTLLNHLWRSEELFRIVHQPSTVKRLLQLLYWLAQRFGKPVPKGRLLEPILTHQQIAEILCTTRVTVTRLLTRLEDEGKLIKFGRPTSGGATDHKLPYAKRSMILLDTL